MAFTLPRDLRGAETFRQVDSLLRSVREPGVDQIVDATDLAPSHDGTTIAFTAWRRRQVSADAAATIGLLDAKTGALHLINDPDEGSSQRMPSWSPDDSRLLCLRTTSDGTDEPTLVDHGEGHSRRLTCHPLVGKVESLAWSPDGTTVAALLAEPGAEISDVFGSGRVPASGSLPDWCPEVAAQGRTGWRRIWLVKVDSGDTRLLESHLNVWEFCWANDSQLAVVASRSPQEDAWYDAELRLVDIRSGHDRLLYSHEAQLAAPAADPAGAFVSAICGTASDRGLLAGDVVVVDLQSGLAEKLPVQGLHVTSQAWCQDGRLLLAGIRGSDTALAYTSYRAGGLEDEWVTHETLGPADLLPVAVPLGVAGAAVVLESHTRPPTCGVVRDGGFFPLLDLSHPGSVVVKHLCSAVRRLSWRSTDGLVIEGHLATPTATPKRPFPLVVLLHGGPVWRWGDVWMERILQVPILLAHGYAVLLPNPRGSQGRGEQFIRGIVGEVGGLDVDDVLSGVEAVAAEGLVDRDRVGVMGTSYGGFLAAWLATRPGAVAAAVAVSPVTDWVSQHFTTNIPQSDIRFLQGPPLDPAAHYWQRSPLVAASERTCPVLLTGGLHDLATPPSQALEMHHALVELGVDSDIAIYPREGHDVHEWPAVLDHATRMLLWFERFLRA